MTDKRQPPEIESLLKVNRGIKRRLRPVFTEESPYIPCFVDADNERIEAQSLGFSIIVKTWTDRPFRYKPAGRWRRPRLYSMHADYELYSLTRKEMQIALGKDFPLIYSRHSFAGLGDLVEANLISEAVDSGPKFSNAYAIGGWTGFIIDSETLHAVPVEYYRIDPERHRKLGIQSDKYELERLIRCLNGERGRGR